MDEDDSDQPSPPAASTQRITQQRSHHNKLGTKMSTHNHQSEATEIISDSQKTQFQRVNQIHQEKTTEEGSVAMQVDANMTIAPSTPKTTRLVANLATLRHEAIHRTSNSTILHQIAASLAARRHSFQESRPRMPPAYPQSHFVMVGW
jgi:hypothetical protein